MKNIISALHSIAKKYTALLKKGWRKNWLFKLGVIVLIMLAWPVALTALCFHFYNKSDKPLVQWLSVGAVILVTLPLTLGWIGGITGSSSTKTAQNTPVASGCIGPDGKHVDLSEEECRKFNDAWKNPPAQNNQAQTNPTNTPKPVEKFNIVVTSQIVKKVNGKYRYFFDIRNKDIKPFKGSVTIELHNTNQKSPLGVETFDTTRPMEVGLGSSQYIDAGTAPMSQEYSDYTINTFTYTVTVNNTTVNSGKGQITDEFEDVDAYGL